jgi:dTDP-4-amino-4,6-dideoxygalactose transaminase
MHGEWQRIGRPHGVMATFSFHPRKLLTTGDGGMVTTRDAALDGKLRLLRQHGMLRSDSPAEVVAFNYRLTDIQAAVARKQLRRLPSMLAERRKQAAYYCDKLSRLPSEAVSLPRQPAWARSNWQSFCVRVDDRDRILHALAERGISARGGIMNAHQQPAYQPNTMSLPMSEAATAHGLILPLFPGMTQAQQDRVVTALAELLGDRS